MRSLLWIIVGCLGCKNITNNTSPKKFMPKHTSSFTVSNVEEMQNPDRNFLKKCKDNESGLTRIGLSCHTLAALQFLRHSKFTELVNIDSIDYYKSSSAKMIAFIIKNLREGKVIPEKMIETFFTRFEEKNQDMFGDRDMELRKANDSFFILSRMLNALNYNELYENLVNNVFNVEYKIGTQNDYKIFSLNSIILRRVIPQENVDSSGTILTKDTTLLNLPYNMIVDCIKAPKNTYICEVTKKRIKKDIVNLSLKKENDTNAVYRLISFGVYDEWKNNSIGGHYYTYGRGENGYWYCYNDSSKHNVGADIHNVEIFFSSNVKIQYMLYEKVEKK